MVALHTLKAAIFRDCDFDVVVEGRKNLNHLHSFQHVLYADASGRVSKAAVVDRNANIEGTSIKVHNAHEDSHS